MNAKKEIHTIKNLDCIRIHYINCLSIINSSYRFGNYSPCRFNLHNNIKRPLIYQKQWQAPMYIISFQNLPFYMQLIFYFLHLLFLAFIYSFYLYFFIAFFLIQIFIHIFSLIRKSHVRLLTFLLICEAIIYFHLGFNL